MADTDKTDRKKGRAIASLVASIIIGLLLVIAGSGKLSFGEVPGQTIEFIGHILPTVFLTPGFIFFIYEIFIPYILPCAEMAIGLSLLVGLWPRLMASLSILLSLAFMGNNIYAISLGMEKYESCSCFGIWEEIFGGLTPVQSLGVDSLMIALAIVIIVLHPGRFMSSRGWITKLGKKKNANVMDEEQESA
ncbi:MAG: hypothetical protein P8105_07605 [Dehalococcoidia bacterium]